MAGQAQDLGASGPPGPPVKTRPDPQLLGRIMAPSVECAPIWPDHELRDILRHQLESSLAFDLSRGNAADAAAIRLEAPSTGPPIRTFGDLFRHPQPPLELLHRVKRFAKSAIADSAPMLPAEIASFLYYGAIAAAFVRAGARITTLNDDALAQGFHSLAAYDWIDDASRMLLDDAARQIDAPR